MIHSQVLVRTPILRIYLLSGRHKCPNPEGLCLMCAVAEIFQVSHFFFSIKTKKNAMIVAFEPLARVR